MFVAYKLDTLPRSEVAWPLGRGVFGASNNSKRISIAPYSGNVGRRGPKYGRMEVEG